MGNFHETSNGYLPLSSEKISRSLERFSAVLHLFAVSKSEAGIREKS